jgi:hypothetical protein
MVRVADELAGGGRVPPRKAGRGRGDWQRRTGVILAALIAMAAGTSIARGATKKTRSCGPAGARTVISRGAVRVYGIADGSAIACDSATGDRVEIANPDGVADYLLPAPAVAIAGSVIAFGEDELGDPTGYETVTFVEVRDLAGPPGASDEIVILPAQPSPVGTGATSKVVKTVVKSDGAVAWISCVGGSLIPESDLAVGGHAVCQHAGEYAWVYSENAATEHGPPQSDGQYPAPTLLDEGTGIVPLSLRLRGSTLTWMHGSKQHSATLS